MPPIVQQKSKQIQSVGPVYQENPEKLMNGRAAAAQNMQPLKLTSKQEKVLSGLQKEIMKLAEDSEVYVRNVEKNLTELQSLEAQINAKEAGQLSEEEKAALQELQDAYKQKQNEYIRSMADVINSRSRQYEKQEDLMKESMRFQHLDLTQECADRIEAGVLEGRIRVLQAYEKDPYKKYLGQFEQFSELCGVLERKLQSLQGRIATRQELKEKAKEISGKARVYLESGFKEGCSSMPGQELLKMYLDYADSIWDKQARKEYLSAGYITEHIVQSLSILEISREFQKKRGELMLTLEEQERLKAADQIFQYYQQHVDTILGDYGMSLDKLAYNGAAIEDLVSHKHVSQQSYRWSEDYDAYRRLLGIREEPDAEGEAMSAGERRLRKLERQAGIIMNVSEGMTASVYDKDSSARLLDDRRQDQQSYVRLKGDILATTAERKRAFSREQRLLAVSKVFVAQLKQDKLWSPDSPINEIPNLLIKDIFSYASNENGNYVVEQRRLLDELTTKLDQILLTSPVFRERQFASVLLCYLSEDQSGELSRKKGDVEYRAEDRNYAGMNKVMKEKLDKNETKKKKKDQRKPREYIDRFESVKDEPLFAHDPVLKDLEQGGMGDCYFIASLASIVARDPGAIKRMMKDNGDGTVTVRFYDKNSMDHKRPASSRRICVTVDKTIPMRTYVGSNLRLEPYSKGALWVKMMEKAYAAVRVRNDENGGEISVRRKGAAIDYGNLDGGQARITMMNLTGEDMMGSPILQKRLDIQTFKGRLQGDVDVSAFARQLDQNKLKRPGNLYYYQKHRNDRNPYACQYLAGKKVPARLADGYKKELKRYQTVEKWLEAMLEEQEGADEIRAMDTSLFVEAIARQISSLRTCLGTLKEYNGRELNDEALRRAGVTAKWNSAIRECWKVCDKNADTFLNTAEGMLGAFAGEMMKDRKHHEYTKQEEKLYAGIQNVLKKGGSCFFGTRKVLGKDADASGSAGEAGSRGIFGNHAYAVIGVEEHQIGGRVKKFLRVFNPHGVGIPLYQIDERNNLKRVSLKAAEEKQYSDATHGVFLLELRDLYSVVSNVAATDMPAV